MKLWLNKFAGTRAGKFLRRYWWAYPAWLVVKWGCVGLLTYVAFADPKESKVKDNDAPSAEAVSAGKVLNLKAGDMLPDFTLEAWLPGKENSEKFRASTLIGKSSFVLYFYPMDDTPGCTKEACALRDGFTELTQQGLTVIGVSADSHESHAAFGEKFSLPFMLLVDADGALRHRLGNPDGSEPLIARITYIVDSHGVVREVVGGTGISVDDHIAAVHKWAEQLAKEKQSAR